jgi:hypothetical protein
MRRTDTGLLVHVDRLGYSTNGNPKHAVTLLLDNGGSLRLFTRHDSSAMQSAPSQGTRVRFTWHRTARGREILDSIERA